jgi:CMP/dCMP kinase
MTLVVAGRFALDPYPAAVDVLLASPVVVIAIDGPAGVGKSSVARAAAERLGFTYLDTGAMYRAVAYRSSNDDADPAEVARSVELELGDRVRVDGEDVTERIREPWVSETSSRVSSNPGVRAALVKQQRRLMSEGDWVAEGRDIGTVVMPDAEVKIFLTASPEERARRRAAELGTDAAVVLKEQTMRDERDRSREHSPLVPAEDAVPVDTTGLSLEEVVEQIVTLAVEAKELEA